MLIIPNTFWCTYGLCSQWRPKPAFSSVHHGLTMVYIICYSVIILNASWKMFRSFSDYVTPQSDDKINQHCFLPMCHLYISSVKNLDKSCVAHTKTNQIKRKFGLLAPVTLLRLYNLNLIKHIHYSIITAYISCTTSVDLDHPAHPSSLVRIYTVSNNLIHLKATDV